MCFYHWKLGIVLYRPAVDMITAKLTYCLWRPLCNLDSPLKWGHPAHCLVLEGTHVPFFCRKVLKQIAVAELQPDETVDAVREARLLAKVGVAGRCGYDAVIDHMTCCLTAWPSLHRQVSRQLHRGRVFLHHHWILWGGSVHGYSSLLPRPSPPN